MAHIAHRIIGSMRYAITAAAPIGQPLKILVDRLIVFSTCNELDSIPILMTSLLDSYML